MLINVHELLMNENVLVAFLNESDPITEASHSEIVNDLPAYGPHKEIGRKTISDKYPQLAALVSDYIKQHSFSTHGRWRETNGTGTGVTLSQIRKHVLENIPEIADISNQTIHRLMDPPTVCAKCVPGRILLKF